MARIDKNNPLLRPASDNDLLALESMLGVLKTIHRDERLRLLRLLVDYLQFEQRDGHKGTAQESSLEAVKAFIERKQPATAKERVLCIVSFVSSISNDTGVRLLDINRANTLAAQSKLPSLQRILDDAVYEGLLRTHGSRYLLTRSGHSLVAELPRVRDRKKLSSPKDRVRR